MPGLTQYESEDDRHGDGDKIAVGPVVVAREHHLTLAALLDLLEDAPAFGSGSRTGPI